MFLIKRYWFLLILGLSACSIGSPDAEVAKQRVEQYFQAQQQQNLEAALGFYSSSEKRSIDNWRSHLEHVSKSLGKVEHHEFKRMEVNTVLSGRFYIFEYQVSYDSGKSAKETLTMYDTVESDDVPGIVAHVILAEGYKPLF